MKINLITAANYYLRVLRDKIQGVDFTKIDEPQTLGLDPKLFFRSSPSGDRFLRKVFEHQSISRSDSILDIGCGKGSALRVMAQFPFSRVDGVEISPKLVEIARKNFRKINMRNINIYNSDIREFNKLNGYNYFYLYNPFAPEIFAVLITKLMLSQKERTRKITIIYNNPVCNSLLVDNGFLVSNSFPDKWGHGITIYKKIADG